MTRNNQENHLKKAEQKGLFVRTSESSTSFALVHDGGLFLIKLSGDESKTILRLLLRISQNVNKRIFMVASGSAAALLHMRALTDRQRDFGADGAPSARAL